jgi:tRNA threonylcarbamoyladenosine biosynthesis protein TsaE
MHASRPLPDRDAGTPAALRLRLASEADTRALGAALAEILGPGDCVLLSGGLGAGKSALARAIVRAALRDPEREVPSPSYTLVNVHEGPRGEIWHADLYRLAGPEEAAELGLDEAAHALLLVEWPDRLGEALPPRRLEIALEAVSEEARDAVLMPCGPGWERLEEAVRQWM